MKRKREKTDMRKAPLPVKCFVVPVTDSFDIVQDRLGSECSFGSQLVVDSGPFEALSEIVDISRVTTSEHHCPGLEKESSGRKLVLEIKIF